MELKEHREPFLFCQHLTSREAYEHYRMRRKKCVNGLNDFNLYKKAVEGLFLTLSNMIVESKGGVYIEGLGYFCLIASKKATKKRGISKGSLLQKSKKHIHYFPYFFPDVELKDTTMSQAFELTIRKKINKSENQYKLHFDLVDTVRIAHDYAKKDSDSRNVRGEFDYRSNLLKKLNR